MNLKPFTGPGSTPSRRRFWDQVTEAVIASQKVAGHNVTTDEHEGMGTFVNVEDSNSRRTKAPPAPPTPSGKTGACCFSDVCEVRTQSECEDADGVYMGDGVPCDPNPCCTTCGPLFVGPPCSVIFGEYWTIQNCDNTCGGEMFTDPSTSFMRHVAYCTTSGEGCSIQSTNCVTVRNLDTCEDVLTGPCDGICPDGQTIIDEVSVVWVPCPELSPPP